MITPCVDVMQDDDDDDTDDDEEEERRAKTPEKKDKKKDKKDSDKKSKPEPEAPKQKELPALSLEDSKVLKEALKKCVFKGVVVGLVKSVSKHPKANDLNVLVITDGTTHSTPYTCEPHLKCALHASAAYRDDVVCRRFHRGAGGYKQLGRGCWYEGASSFNLCSACDNVHQGCDILTPRACDFVLAGCFCSYWRRSRGCGTWSRHHNHQSYQAEERQLSGHAVLGQAAGA
jgi:tRNA-binding EMAP/Myf-like protein